MADGDGRDDHSHYFSPAPGGPERLAEFVVRGPRGDLTLRTSSGVFASRGLDKGTAVLVDLLSRHPAPPPPAGSHLCDVGCGSGAISLLLASAHPDCTVHAIDVNERARRLCSENAGRNGLTNVVVEAPEEVDRDLRFHLVRSNPPVRIGKEALHALLAHWLDALHPDGLAELVVARNLGADSLAEWMTARGHTVERLGSAKGFRVMRVRPVPR